MAKTWKESEFEKIACAEGDELLRLIAQYLVYISESVSKLEDKAS